MPDTVHIRRAMSGVVSPLPANLPSALVGGGVGALTGVAVAPPTCSVGRTLGAAVAAATTSSVPGT